MVPKTIWKCNACCTSPLIDSFIDWWCDKKKVKKFYFLVGLRNWLNHILSNHVFINKSANCDVYAAQPNMKYLIHPTIKNVFFFTILWPLCIPAFNNSPCFFICSGNNIPNFLTVTHCIWSDSECEVEFVGYLVRISRTLLSNNIKSQKCRRKKRICYMNNRI